MNRFTAPRLEKREAVNFDHSHEFRVEPFADVDCERLADAAGTFERERRSSRRIARGTAAELAQPLAQTFHEEPMIAAPPLAELENLRRLGLD